MIVNNNVTDVSVVMQIALLVNVRLRRGDLAEAPLDLLKIDLLSSHFSYTTISRKVL